jgi:muramoyltetrapeptide carboxypeptidase
MLKPRKLKPGDKVRFVSPASTPDEEGVRRAAEILKGWGFAVDYGENAFKKLGPFAGSDDERAADLNAALRDPSVRAVFATRGGRGCYRIADCIDFDAVRSDPKLLIGFSENTILHLMLWKQCRLPGIHGAVFEAKENNHDLHAALTGSGDFTVAARPDELTATLTTQGRAQGLLIGGNLEMIATAAGWALPELTGAILLLEGIDMRTGQTDRIMTMLRKGGHLDGIVGIAVGQFTNFSSGALALLRDQLHALGVPILGGLPFGHGTKPVSVPIGLEAKLDADAATLTVAI